MHLRYTFELNSEPWLYAGSHCNSFQIAHVPQMHFAKENSAVMAFPNTSPSDRHLQTLKWQREALCLLTSSGRRFRF